VSGRARLNRAAARCRAEPGWLRQRCHYRDLVARQHLLALRPGLRERRAALNDGFVGHRRAHGPPASKQAAEQPVQVSLPLPDISRDLRVSRLPLLSPATSPTQAAPQSALLVTGSLLILHPQDYAESWSRAHSRSPGLPLAKFGTATRHRLSHTDAVPEVPLYHHPLTPPQRVQIVRIGLSI
jgi:hypothetical protein